MQSVFEIIMAVSLLVGVGRMSKRLHHQIKKEALAKVFEGLPSMTSFTKNLTK